MPSKSVAKRSQAAVAGVGQLDLDDLKNEDEQQLHARGVAYAQEYVRARDVAATMVKNLAVVVYSVRLYRGDPRGEGWDTKQAVKAIYDSANLDDETRERLSNAVRYHVGNLQRAHLSPRELKRLGLKEASPLERMKASRAANQTLLNGARVSSQAAKAKSSKTSTGADEGALPETTDVRIVANQMKLADAALAIVRRLDADVLVSEAVTDGQRNRVDEDLAAMQEEIARLRRKIRRRPKAKG
ncbi:hypothetical protein HEK616_40830 [Streptomyces nigrescens]|uniref:Uncharacterized protein n=1 Tax=Streptomyces nigrescens TaxID=1920 RepID=A0ABM7ZW67_STRNI|nr:hypothetical protein [Streptomyces nigrescens]BDM70596.1 hypothetical protein HEK616_40830 [Streptomyces nigrescens]